LSSMCHAAMVGVAGPQVNILDVPSAKHTCDPTGRRRCGKERPAWRQATLHRGAEVGQAR
jgi:hypothetical protein